MRKPPGKGVSLDLAAALRTFCRSQRRMIQLTLGYVSRVPEARLQELRLSRVYEYTGTLCCVRYGVNSSQ
jgi:hypothetical protein